MTTSELSAIKYLFDAELLDEMRQEGRIANFSPGEEIMDIGQQVTRFPIILSGSLKVMTENEKGQEMLLYFLESGDTCAMTMQCCFGNKKSSIRVVSETDTEILFVPVQKMEEWLLKYSSWRSFVFDNYQARLDEMLHAVDQLAFDNLEERLYKYLKDKAMVNRNPKIEITHHQAATDLNTSRVVVSRLMKKLEKQNLIAQERGTVKILEFEG